MTKISFIICMTILISSCISPQIIDPLPPGVRIGYVPLKLTRKLCHNHIGWTVFGNEKKQYSLNFDFDRIVISSLEKLAKKNNHYFIEIKEPKMFLTDFFTFNSWSGEATIIKSKKVLLDRVILSNKLDIILFPGARLLDDSSSTCSIRYMTHSPSKSNIVWSKQHMAAFEAKTYKKLDSNAGVAGERVKDFYPDNIEELTVEDVKKLYPFIEKSIIDGNRDLFKTLQLGEFEYEEIQI